MNGLIRAWRSAPLRAKVPLVLAAVLTGVGCLVLFDEWRFQRGATRVVGTVVAFDGKWPVLEYEWGGRQHQLVPADRPVAKMPVGTDIGVFVAPDGAARPDNPAGTLFIAGWFCWMPAAIFILLGAGRWWSWRYNNRE